MKMLSCFSFAALNSPTVILANMPDRCAFAMAISRSRKSLIRVYTAWFTTSECAPVSFSMYPTTLRVDSLRSNPLIISGVTRLLRSLFIFSRCLRLLYFSEDMDQRRAFSAIWLTRAGSTSTHSGFSDVTYEQKCLKLRRYALMVSAVYFVSACFKKMSRRRLFLNKDLKFFVGSIISRIRDNWEACCLDSLGSFLPPSADCNQLQKENITSSCCSSFEKPTSANSIISSSSLFDGTSEGPVLFVISTSFSD